jgi:hypothetical protein
MYKENNISGLESPVLCFCRDMLQSREERRQTPEATTIESEPDLEEVTSVVLAIAGGEVIDESSTLEIVPAEVVQREIEELVQSELPTPASSSAPIKRGLVNIFYKDGQDLEKCLIANSARRAEARKLRHMQKQQADEQRGGGGGGVVVKQSVKVGVSLSSGGSRSVNKGIGGSADL